MLYTYDSARKVNKSIIGKPVAYDSEIYDGLKTVFSKRYSAAQYDKLISDRGKWQQAYKKRHPNCILSSSVSPLFKAA